MRFGTGGAGTKGYTYDQADLATLNNTCYTDYVNVKRTDNCTFAVDTVPMPGLVYPQWQCDPDASTECRPGNYWGPDQPGPGSAYCTIPNTTFTQTCTDTSICMFPDTYRQAYGTKVPNYKMPQSQQDWVNNSAWICPDVPSPAFSYVDQNGCCPDLPRPTGWQGYGRCYPKYAACSHCY